MQAGACWVGEALERDWRAMDWRARHLPGASFLPRLRLGGPGLWALAERRLPGAVYRPPAVQRLKVLTQDGKAPTGP